MKLGRTHISLTCLLFTFAIPASCTSQQPTVAIVYWITKARPSQRWVSSQEISLFAARSEYESFQVVINANDAAVRNLRVSVASPLSGSSGTIPSNNITIYREAYYNAMQASDSEGAPGLWPDALIPTVDSFFNEERNAFPIDIPAKENRVAWIDILVPGDAGAGSYEGVLAVTADGFSTSVHIHLTVLNFSIPTTSSLATAFGMGFAKPCVAFYGDDCRTHEEDGWRTKAMFVRSALDNRITISYPQYQPITSPTERAYFRQYVLPLLDGTASTKLAGARLTSIQVDDDNETQLAAWRSEANGSSFSERAFVYACDEPLSDSSLWVNCKNKATSALQTWPQVKILITASINEADAADATTVIDTLVPLVRYMGDKPGTGPPYEGNQRPSYNAFLTDPRNQVWMYTSCESEGCDGTGETDPYWVGWPGYVIDAPAVEARAMGWLSFIFETTGELYFAVDLLLPTAWTDQFNQGGNGDGTMFYPGTPAMIGGTDPIPIESIRLKLIREGYEDYEYLKFLADHGQRTQAMAIAANLFPNIYDTNQPNGAPIDARKQLANLIQGIVGGPSP
jgi:hypothetical protein